MRNRFNGLKPGSLLARLEGLFTALAVAFPNPGIPTLLSPKRRRRALKLSHWKAGMMAGSAVLTLATGVSTVGVAAAAPVLINLGTQFEMDGNWQVDGTAPCDWGNVNTPMQTGKTACANVFSKSGAIKDLFVNGADPSAYTTGSHDTNDIPTWGCTVKPFDQKNNILYAYGAAFLESAPLDASNPTHRVVYFGQERASNNGDAFAGFWLLHDGSANCAPPTNGNAAWSGKHQDGDLLVVSNYTGGGGTNTVEVFAWINGALDQTPVVIGPDCGSTGGTIAAACTIDNNSGTIGQPPWNTAQSLAPNEFVETAVDLTAVDETLAQPPLFLNATGCFSNFVAETRSSQSATADLHDYAQGKVNTCPTPSIATTANGTTSTTVGQTVLVGDTATLSNGNNPTGTVTFDLYGPTSASPNGVCNSTDHVLGPFQGSVSNNQASTTGNSFTPSKAGTYYWVASYGGDNQNNASGPSTCGDPAEAVVVGKASPTFTTQAVPTTGTAGVTISVIGDSATFANTVSVAPPTGSVTFTLYSNSGCTTAASPAVSGSGTISTSGGTSSASYTQSNWTPSTTGTYYWKAVYNGDSNNNGFTECAGSNEELVISANSPTITTQASPVSGTAGVAITNLSDTATFHGTSSAPTGSVSFQLYSDASCANAVSGVGGSGAIVTTSGTSTATYTKASWTPSATGTYYWKASYAGDTNNNGFTTGCNDSNEEVVIGKASPTITTQANPTSGTAGVAHTYGDTATFHSTTLTPPTGSVTFTLYSDSNCTNAVTSGSGTISTTGGVSTASWTSGSLSLAAGTYYWKASYAGDANNNGFTTGCGDTNEVVTIGKASPTITTNASPTTGSVGIPMTVGDTATFHNTTAIAPTGDVSFTFYSNNTCTSAVAGVGGSGGILTVGSASTANYSTSWTPSAPGTYYWIASYAGDSNNNGFTTGCGDANEEVTILAPSLSLTKVADHTTSVPAGTPIGFTITLTNHGPGTAAGVLLSDTLPDVPTASGAKWQEAAPPTMTGADLSGVSCSLSTGSPQVFSCGSGAGFQMAPGDSISVHLTHATDALSASSGTPAGKYPNTATATASNTTVPPASATEFVEALSTTPSVSSAQQTPANVSDTATLTGGNAPIGTITFQLYGPGDTTCTTNLVAGDSTYTVALDSTGHATSPAYTATKAGTYQWVAVYSGDAKNAPLSGACGDATEQFTTFTQAVLPANTGDTSIFMVLGIPFILTGLVLFGLSWRRREEQA